MNKILIRLFAIISVFSVILIWPIYWVLTGEDIVDLTKSYFDKKLKPEEAEDE